MLIHEVCFWSPLEQDPGSCVLLAINNGGLQTQASSFSMTALVCTDSQTRPQILSNTCCCPVLSPDCSLVGSLQIPLFRNSPHSVHAVLPSNHPLISCTGHVYSMKPFRTPSTPWLPPNQAEKGPLPGSPRGHLQISIITPNLSYYNWHYFHIYPHAWELSESTGSA